MRKDLFVKPEGFGGTFSPFAAMQETAFPVYRESTSKFYLPRFYGIARYGIPPHSEIEPGETISVDFTKELRDYQENIIQIYTKYVQRTITEPATGGCAAAVPMGSGAILEVPCGRGKTVMALKIISILKKKTLIIVHKEFLMNQWIERIAEFLPTAKVGKIQGPVFDIVEKDIVIGMIQTLYDKDFPADTFSSFGLTVIDEVHRIGSEQFSKTLFKTITPYMLGISATVERKDKLTKILYMFIGERIYSESTREEVDPVCVRAIEYKTSDTEFNEVETDFKGQPQYSKMIVKLCDFVPRSEFIVNVIRDLIEEHPENQIMILAHNRSILTYLYDAIQARGLATVGYYLGGMKQKNLQESESRQVVIATYAMAAEALDIKTLSTLVMVTPKTDIIQSVGRILRVKHEHPIIVDIVDQHDLFQNQWRQRMRYYKKCDYRIRKIDSPRYRGMSLDWETDTTWKRVYEPTSSKCVKKGTTETVAEDDDEDEGEETDAVSYSSSAKIGKCLIDLSAL